MKSKSKLILCLASLSTVLVLIGCADALLLDISDAVVRATTISAPAVSGVDLTNDPTPTWTWSPVPDAQNYRFGFSEDQWIEPGSEDLAFTPETDLAEGSYTLHVQAGKGADLWSSSATFTTVVDLTPPAAPEATGVTPTNDTTPTWSWNAVADAVAYRYGFSEEVWVVEDAVDLSFTPSTASALEDGDHTLYVQAQDAASNWSASGVFTITVDQSIPDTIDPPTTPDPTSGSFVMDMTPLLGWEDISYADMFHLQLNTAMDFTGTSVVDDSSISVSEYQVSTPLTPGQTYYWRVKTRSYHGPWGVAWSAVWSFTVPGKWAMSLGDTNFEAVNAVSSVSDGGLVVAGYSYSYGTSATNGDLFIAKTDALGAVEWEKTLAGDYTGDGYSDSAFTVQETGDNGFLVAGYGTFSGLTTGSGWQHPWIVKLSSAGTVEWERLIGGVFDEWINSIDETSDGGVVVSGFTPNLGADGEDAWVFKLDASHDLAWANLYSGSVATGARYDRAESIAETSDGGLIVAGYTSSFVEGESDEAWIMKLTSGGAVSWANCYGVVSSGRYDRFYDVIQTSDGGYLAVGSSKLSGSDIDVLVMKVNSSGTVQWIQTIGGTYEEAGFSVLETASGDFVIGGYTDTYTVEDDGTDDAWMIKLNSSGAVIWDSAFGGSGNDFFNEISGTSTSGYVGAGYTYSHGEGQNDAWIIAVDGNGDCHDLDRDYSTTSYGAPAITNSGLTTDFTETATTVTVTDVSLHADLDVIDTSISSSETTTTMTATYQEP